MTHDNTAHLKFPRNEQSEVPSQFIPSWKLAIIQMLATLMPIIGILYQGFVVLPEIRHTRHEFEMERVKESAHMDKMEALRKANVTERGLMLLDLREARKLAKSTQQLLTLPKGAE